MGMLKVNCPYHHRSPRNCICSHWS